jgi:NitT/TauT family transport system substrate-binding protein
MPMMQTRRRFLTTVSMTGAAGFLCSPPLLAAEETLETTTVRLVYDHSICIAPILVAEELLRAEGFTDIRYVDMPWTGWQQLLPVLPSATADFRLITPWNAAIRIDKGEAITVLGGTHIGCFELFAREGIRNVADLKGKSVGLRYAAPTLLSLMAAYVGLDPKEDFRWVTLRDLKPVELFAEGNIDAFLGFPPEPQELRARHAGQVIVNTGTDRPWSQYFCCMLIGSHDYVRKYPVATKRVLRATLKATDFCGTEPALAAQRLVDGGFTARFDYALETLSANPYNKWREYDAEDTVRFYALGLREAGFIKASPQRIIADGTDWRFLNELKRELKV